MRVLGWFLAVSLLLTGAASAFAMCPIPAYITDANDLVQINGKLYDNAGNETKVKCNFSESSAAGAYIAATGGFSTPPTRSLQGASIGCPALDWELSHPIGAAGADVQIVKKGVARNECAFVGQLSAGSGWPNGFYMSSVLKFDPVAGFKSEKGTLIYNLTSGSFVGTFKIVARP